MAAGKMWLGRSTKNGSGVRTEIDLSDFVIGVVWILMVFVCTDDVWERMCVLEYLLIFGWV